MDGWMDESMKLVDHGDQGRELWVGLGWFGLMWACWGSGWVEILVAGWSE